MFWALSNRTNHCTACSETSDSDWSAWLLVPLQWVVCSPLAEGSCMPRSIKVRLWQVIWFHARLKHTASFGVKGVNKGRRFARQSCLVQIFSRSASLHQIKADLPYRDRIPRGQKPLAAVISSMAVSFIMKEMGWVGRGGFSKFISHIKDLWKHDCWFQSNVKAGLSLSTLGTSFSIRHLWPNSPTNLRCGTEKGGGGWTKTRERKNEWGDFKGAPLGERRTITFSLSGTGRTQPSRF